MNDFVSHLACAIEASRLAAVLILEGLDAELSINDKGSSNNLVTQIDTACEAAIVSHISANFPDHDFMGEEASYPDTGSNWLWIIDPLDGTTNYIKGIRYFSVSIALADRSTGQVVVGVVYNPVSTELFYATANGGAWLSVGGAAPRKLQASTKNTLEESILITGFYYDRGQAMRRTLHQIQHFLEQGVMDIRRFGSAALDLCLVAAGRAEGFWEHTLHPWDFAGASLIAAEAGCVVSDELGAPLGFQKSMVVVANPTIHRIMLPLLADV